MTIWDINLGSVADIIVALVAVIGVPFALWELRSNTRTRRASFLLEATERYFSDPEVRRLYYDIDYGRFTIDFETGSPGSVRRGDSEARPFIGSDEERLLDHLLYTLETIGRIVEMKALDAAEARIFAFQARRVLGNESVSSYVGWVSAQRADGSTAWSAARVLAGLL